MISPNDITIMFFITLICRILHLWAETAIIIVQKNKQQELVIIVMIIDKFDCVHVLQYLFILILLRLLLFCMLYHDVMQQLPEWEKENKNEKIKVYYPRLDLIFHQKKYFPNGLV